MKAMLSTFFRDESGATAIEYGLIAVGIAIAIIAAVAGLDCFNSFRVGFLPAFFTRLYGIS